MVGPTGHFLFRVCENVLCFMAVKGPKLNSGCNVLFPDIQFAGTATIYIKLIVEISEYFKRV